MGRTYDALEWAEKEFQAKQRMEPSECPEADRPRDQRPGWLPSGLMGFEGLKTNLLSRIARRPGKLILFTATAHGDGTTTAVINFAAGLTRDSQFKVLLVDANLGTSTRHNFFSGRLFQSLVDIVTRNGSQPLCIGPEAESIHVLSSVGPHPHPLGLIESPKFDVFLETARQKYEYIILDIPPIQTSPYCRVLCAKADGVVLVIRSGKTRREVALRTKKELEEAGGKILGVVLNRRKCYIPNFIYERF
jgi:capsular exopolysaccharide synthesis family protein